jgi:hypothetical protein
LYLKALAGDARDTAPLPQQVSYDGTTVWAAFPAFALRVEPQERLAASRINQGRKVSGDFMETWFNWMLVLAIATGPFSTYMGVLRLIRGDDSDHDPAGCVALGWLLLATSPFIGWWVYHNFAVTWRP